MFDVVIEGGLFFDGTGAPGVRADVAIAAGRVAAVGPGPFPDAARRVDARGAWVMPGFVDMHTHYDAELLAAPALSESIRHGVTTVTVGSCSISTILSDAEDCSDLVHARRVGAARRGAAAACARTRRWDSPRGYVDFLQQHPLGPNVTAFLGHSDLRTRVIGLERAVDGRVRPTRDEMATMERLLEDALDCGLLGLSTMTNPWDKLDGDRYRSAQLPSTYATWGEYRRLHRVLRRRGRILQSAPKLVTKVNAFLFLLESAGLGWRKPLKTTLITLADAKSSPGLHRVHRARSRASSTASSAATCAGRRCRCRSRSTPTASTSSCSRSSAPARRRSTSPTRSRATRSCSDEAYRRRFRKDYETRWSPRVWQRDFHDAHIVACPDGSVVGRSFGDVADARGIHPVDAYPRSRRRAREEAPLAHDDRQPSAARGRAHDEGAGGAHRLRRLGRAHPQHGVLQLPPAHAEGGARRRARRAAGDADRACGVAA